MEKRIVKYNPAFLTDQELLDIFVVRHTDLELLLQTVRENSGPSNQHLLVYGPRGIGKTTLVLRLALEIRQDPELNGKWYPLIFSEESYQVTTPGEFWLEALFHLAQQTEDDRWKRTHEELVGERDEARLRERALAQLMDFSDAEGKRILLVVENLNMLLGDQMSDDDAWVIRHTLQNEKRLMLLATATSSPEDTENSNKAMFDLFKPHRLDALNQKECQQIWSSVTEMEVKDDRVRAIHILTGGNPRLLTIISTFGKHLSFKELMTDLTNLVDEHTEYFKSHLDNLPPVERKVYLTLLDTWDPATAQTIANAARLDVSKTSSLLKRLTTRYLVVVEDRPGRTKWYRASERLFNIYYLMRRRGSVSGRVHALVEFMISCYGPELSMITRQILEEATALPSADRMEHIETIKGLFRDQRLSSIWNELRSKIPQKLIDSRGFPEELKEMFRATVLSVEPLISQTRMSDVDLIPIGSSGETATTDEEHNEHARKLLESARAMRDEPGKRTEAEKMYREALKLSTDKANFWYELGDFLSTPVNETKERYEEAADAYKNAIALNPRNIGAWLGTAHLLHQNLGRYTEAREAYQKASELQNERIERCERMLEDVRAHFESTPNAGNILKKEIEDWQNIVSNLKALRSDVGVQLGVLLEEKLQDYSESENAFRNALDMYPSSAIAWLRLGNLLRFHLLRYPEAEAAYLKTIELDPERESASHHLVGMLAGPCDRTRDALKLVKKRLSVNSKDTRVLYGFAWHVYNYDRVEFFPQAEEFARMGANSSEDHTAYQQVLASVLCSRGKWYEALDVAKEYLGDDETVKKTLQDAERLFVHLGAAAMSREALDMIRKSPSAEYLEPLVVALQLHLGEDVTVAVEILEVAKDIVERIKEKKEQLKKAGLPVAGA